MNSFLISARRVAMLGVAVGTLGIALGGVPDAQAVTGKGGWQTTASVAVPTGVQHGFFTYSCPTGLVARSGAFFPDPTLQTLGINIGVNAPRLDLGTGGFNGWGFEYNIPGGAPAGTSFLVNVYCTKAPI